MSEKTRIGRLPERGVADRGQINEILGIPTPDYLQPYEG